MEDYKKAVGECGLVIMSGSVAKGIPADIYGQLVETGKEAGLRCILDTSGEALLHGIKAVPFMIKPNQKELEYLRFFNEKQVDGVVLVATVFTSDHRKALS